MHLYRFACLQCSTAVVTLIVVHGAIAVCVVRHSLVLSASGRRCWIHSSSLAFSRRPPTKPICSWQSVGSKSSYQKVLFASTSAKCVFWREFPGTNGSNAVSSWTQSTASGISGASVRGDRTFLPRIVDATFDTLDLSSDIAQDYKVWTLLTHLGTFRFESMSNNGFACRLKEAVYTLTRTAQGSRATPVAVDESHVLTLQPIHG